MKHLFSLILLTTFFVTPCIAHAYEVKVAPDILINENYISDDNLYVAGGHTQINTAYEKDVVSAALDQSISGTIFGDVLSLGNTIKIDGEMFGDTRVIGNVVHISGVTNQDLIIVANQVFIDKDAIINGDSLILANSVLVEGQFLGESQITANSLEVSGSLLGPSVFTAQNISFKTGSKIISDVAYFSPQRANIESGVEIQKPLNFNQIESITQNDVVKKIFFAFVSFWSIIRLIAMLFLVFILTHLFRVFSQQTIDIVQHKKAFTILTGIFSLLCIPIAIVVLFASLVLSPVSIILALLFGIVLIITPAMSAIVLAYLYRTYIQKKQKHTVEFNTSALALIAITFIGFVPYIGSILVYLLYIGTFGAIVQYLYDQIRRKKLKF